MNSNYSSFTVFVNPEVILKEEEEKYGKFFGQMNRLGHRIILVSELSSPVVSEKLEKFKLDIGIAENGGVIVGHDYTILADNSIVTRAFGVIRNEIKNISTSVVNDGSINSIVLSKTIPIRDIENIIRQKDLGVSLVEGKTGYVLCPSNIDKGKAILELSSRQQIPPDQHTIGIGDGEIDIPLFSQVDEKIEFSKLADTSTHKFKKLMEIFHNLDERITDESAVDSKIPEILNLLKRGRIKEFNELKQNLNFTKIDLSKTNFKKLDLQGIDLSKMNLTSCDFTGANLKHANLKHTNFSKSSFAFSDLSYCNLSFSDLSYCNLTNANLSNSQLIETDLQYVDLRHANIHHIHLKNVHLKNSNILGTHLDESDLKCENPVVKIEKDGFVIYPERMTDSKYNFIFQNQLFAIKIDAESSKATIEMMEEIV